MSSANDGCWLSSGTAEPNFLSHLLYHYTQVVLYTSICSCSLRRELHPVVHYEAESSLLLQMPICICCHDGNVLTRVSCVMCGVPYLSCRPADMFTPSFRIRYGSEALAHIFPASGSRRAGLSASLYLTGMSLSLSAYS